MHFDAVLIFVSFNSHNLKVTRVKELSTDFSVDAATIGYDRDGIVGRDVYLRS